MRIAQIAPLAESVPPALYGGTERIVSYLTEELVRQGHDVTLFAASDSITAAKLIPAVTRALQLEQVRKRAHQFDVLHFHTEFLHFPLFRSQGKRTLTTLHGRLDLPYLLPFYSEFDRMPVVSISEDQRRPLPSAHWIGTVAHGIPPGATRFYPQAAGGYLAFLGRISPEKRPDRAIEIAKRSGVRLKIAAKVDRADQAYFESVIRPLLNDPLIEWVGEIGQHEKQHFLGNALAMLFPVDWPEPFGLVMIEAMACGTPTIAYRRGSVPEVIEQGVSGMIVDNEDAAVQAVRTIETINRAGVRECFERRFTAERMAADYLRLYRRCATESGRLSAVQPDDEALDTDETCDAMPTRESSVPGRAVN
jgi:glycosyltransferase involved in cell wall biosynthesis